MAALATLFSKYEDSDLPRYYYLPSGTSLDPVEAGFWALDNDVSLSHALVSAIDFVSANSHASRLVITLTLWLGKNAVCAKALIDLGLEGDCVDLAFVANHSLGLLKRKHPITCSSFDGSTEAAGPITHFWSG